MPSPDFLALNPELAAPGSASATLRPARGRGGRSGRPAAPGGAQALAASPVGSSYQGRLDKAAANGWHAIESPDAERYRWRTNAGQVGPWGTYEEATAYGAACCPVRTER